MDVKLFLVADYANVEKSGKLNVMGVFDRIYVTTVPATHPSLCLVTRVELTQGEFDVDHDIKFIFVDEDGNEIVEYHGVLNIPQRSGIMTVNHDILMTLNRLPIPGMGRYEFRLIINRDVRRIVALDVEMVKRGDDDPQIDKAA